MDNSGFGKAPVPIDKQPTQTPGTMLSRSTTGGSEDAKTTIAKLTLAAQIKGGASWFYWIAALSLINTLAAMSGTNWRFVIGLGITQVVDAVAAQAGGMAKMAGLVVDIFIAGLFALFGVFASRREKWAFLVGMVLFGLDAGLEFLSQHWLGLAFHVYVLYRIYRGFSRIQMLHDVNEFSQVGT